MGNNEKLEFNFDFLDVNSAQNITTSKTNSSEESNSNDKADMASQTNNSLENKTVITATKAANTTNSHINIRKYFWITIGFIIVFVMIISLFILNDKNPKTSYSDINYKRELAYNSYLNNEDKINYLYLVNEIAQYDGITTNAEFDAFEERKFREREDILNIAIDKFENNSSFDFETYRNLNLKLYFNDDIEIFNTLFDDKYGKKALTLKEQSMPKTSILYTAKWINQNRPLLFYIKADSDYNYSLILFNKNTQKADFVAFVNAGDDISLNVPSSNYEIYYAKGEKWYGEDSQFGIKAKYSILNQTLSFLVLNNQLNTYSLVFKDYPFTSDLYRETFSINNNDSLIKMNEHQKLELNSKEINEEDFINIYNQVKQNHKKFSAKPNKVVQKESTQNKTIITKHTKYELIDNGYYTNYSVAESMLNAYNKYYSAKILTNELGFYYIRIGIFDSKVAAEMAQHILETENHVTKIREINEQ